MFDTFSGVWTPLVLARDLGKKPLPFQIADTPVVLFRDGEGRASAVLDRCPHRGVALSLGRVEDGCLRCPFHGWTFDGEGRTHAVPWNPDAKLERLTVPAFPVVEEAGLVWMHTAPLAPGAPPPEPPKIADVLRRSDVRLAAIDVDFAVHWTRAMENMLDWPHLPFVHGASIGKSLRDHTASRMDIRLETMPWGFRSSIAVDGIDQPGVLELWWPNVMVLTIPVPKKTLVLAAVCVPVSAKRTRMFVVSGRDFLRPAVFDGIFERTNRPILEEDRAIVESSAPAEVPPPSDELSVRTDAPTLWFRKRYWSELRGAKVSLPLAKAKAGEGRSDRLFG